MDLVRIERNKMSNNLSHQVKYNCGMHVPTAENRYSAAGMSNIRGRKLGTKSSGNKIFQLGMIFAGFQAMNS
jgi:hypothetical protein